MQVAFAFFSPLVWDKSPNVFGEKAIAVDPTGVVVDSADEWRHCAASIGSHLLRLAISQGLIDADDLLGYKDGDIFTLEDVIAKRQSLAMSANKKKRAYEPRPRDVNDMCDCFLSSSIAHRFVYMRYCFEVFWMPVCKQKPCVATGRTYLNVDA